MFGVSETWLSSCSDVLGSEALDIREYNFVREDRRGRGGGVGLYIKDRIPFKLVISECNDVVEHMWVEIEYCHKSIAVGVVLDLLALIVEIL